MVHNNFRVYSPISSINSSKLSHRSNLYFLLRNGSIILLSKVFLVTTTTVQLKMQMFYGGDCFIFCLCSLTQSIPTHKKSTWVIVKQQLCGFIHEIYTFHAYCSFTFVNNRTERNKESILFYIFGLMNIVKNYLLKAKFNSDLVSLKFCVSRHPTNKVAQFDDFVKYL